MNRITQKFKELLKKNEKALIGYFTAGFPDYKSCKEVIIRSVNSGLDILEIGIPFSDPIADGPTIQYTSNIALKNGINIEKVFSLCEELKSKIPIPYLLMTYYNPVYKYGLEKFAEKAREVGVSGVIVPDLPYDENREFKEILERRDIFLINFLTPFTNFKRGIKILRQAKGFIYYITMAGVTGTDKDFEYKSFNLIPEFKKIKNVPFAAGFGIFKIQQIKKIKKYVDGVIVGSYFLKKLIYGKIKDVEKSVREFKRELK